MTTKIYHPVPETFLTAIGNITVSFALLETWIQHLVGSLIREHQRVGQIITAELSFAQLRALAFSLFLDRFGESDEDLKELKKLMARAESVEIKRNHITHSIWLAGTTTDEITRMKTTAKHKKGLRHQFTIMTVASLNLIVADIQEVATDIQAFCVRLVLQGKLINNPSNKQW